ncbi:MAG: LysR family transcriptional regulator [Clostridia bacterium]|nr:LysR family transcriptional regulator [Clostridia bacterium]
MEMNVQKYMAFIKTVECGSFTTAANILNYSQSGISRMVSDLEKEWGVSLLERSRSGVRLTSDGLKLLPLAQNLCNEYNKLQLQVEELKGLQSGLIRIGTFSSAATHWLPNIIKEFQKDYPDIDYELLLGDYSEIESWISEGRVDCGFIRLPTLSEFETIFLEEDKFLVVLPENHELADCEYFPVNALCNYPFMLLEKGSNTEISKIFEQNNISPKIRFTTWDDYAIMSMVESGLGISILPKLILQRVPYNIITKELEVPAHRKIGLALRDKKNVSLAVKKFLDYIKYR